MIRHSLSTLRAQAASFGVAAVMTLAVLGSLASIANSQHAEALQSLAAEPTVQQVVIVGQRAPRT